jgi:transposase
MFIRAKYKLDPFTKRKYVFFQLIESVRTERGPRQRILLNLGSELGLSPEELKELANRVEEIVSGQTTCALPEPKIEKLAQMYASRLVKNLAQPAVDKETASVPDFTTIDLQSVVHQEARTVGSEDLLLRIAKELKLPEKLSELQFSSKQIAVALGSIIARATFPASERATYLRLASQSGLGELLDLDFGSTSPNHFYEISDQLLRHKEALEEHVTTSQKLLHHHTDTIVLYDLTNTYFEGQAKANGKAQFGVSKEKRSDCRLITLGLVLNQHGFLNRSKFLSGNVSEPKSLKDAIEALSSTNDLLKPTIVMDAGIATEDNLQWLRENRYTYIVSARKKGPPVEINGEPVLVGNSTNIQVKVTELPVKDDQEKWLYCESPAKEATASSMKTFFQRRFEADLAKLTAGLQKPRGRKKLPKVLERIGRLREKHRSISGCYEINAIPSEDGLIAVRLEWKVLTEKLADKLTGRYYLRTNLVERGAKELWDLYNSIRTVEDAFRFMKSSLGMRPVYHQKEHRVDGHLWITILAYTLIQETLYRLRSKGITYNWETIRTQLNSRVRVSMRAKTDSTTTVHLRTTTEAEQFHLEIYRALGFSAEILKSKKTVV